MRIRLIRNRKEEHIKARLFVCVLAYLPLSSVELLIRKKEPGLTAVRTLDVLRNLTRRVPRLISKRRAKTVLGHINDRG